MLWRRVSGSLKLLHLPPSFGARPQIGMTRQDNPPCIRIQILDSVEENSTAHGGHALVADDHLHLVQCQYLKTLGGRPCRQNMGAIPAQQALQCG
jgi:hypothetical protein